MGGGEGGHSGERGLRLRGRGTRSLQQAFKQPQQPRRPPGPLPGPRDPTASWKEFPEGNRGSSSSLSRTGKPEKAKRPGQLSGSDQTSAETGSYGRKEVGARSGSLRRARLSPRSRLGTGPPWQPPTGTGGWLPGNPLSKRHRPGRVLEAPSRGPQGWALARAEQQGSGGSRRGGWAGPRCGLTGAAVVPLEPAGPSAPPQCFLI